MTAGLDTGLSCHTTTLIQTVHLNYFFPLPTGRSNSNQTVYLGEAVEMRCDALERKTVRWRKDGAVLQVKTTGYDTSLLISTVQQSDEEIYTCDIINSTGEIQASYNVTLRVKGQCFEHNVSSAR